MDEYTFAYRMGCRMLLWVVWASVVIGVAWVSASLHSVELIYVF